MTTTAQAGGAGRMVEVPQGTARRTGHGFWPLIATQFQGAFSENALKYLAIFLVLGTGLGTAERDRMVLLVGVLFAAPFLLFSLTGGFLADRFSKRTVTVATKLFEVAATLVALAGLAAGSLPVVFAAVFLVSTQGALFGPSKYGLLPELLPEPRLSWGNGVLELGTFAAIVAGSAAGAALSGTFRSRPAIPGAILVALALAGLATSLFIARVPAADPARRFTANPWTDFRRQLAPARADRPLWLALCGNGWFFFFAALLQFNILFYGSDVLHVGETRNGLLAAAVGLGIGFGSLLAGYLSGNQIEYGLIPFGALGMTVSGAGLALPHLSEAAFATLLALCGVFGGFFAVPVNAMLQHRPRPETKGGVLAAANLVSFAAVALASGVYYVLSGTLHLGPRAIFALAAAAMLGGTLYALRLMPDAFLRLVLWGATHTVYRMRVVGREHVPTKGGALLVCNHMSFADVALLVASAGRPIRFLVYKGIYDHPVVRPFARMMGAIPISSDLRPREMIRALRTAGEAIRQGELVCIFAEGQITRIGHLLPFKSGLTRIVKDVDAPIIPVCLDGVWGSIFSFERGRFLWKMPRRMAHRLTVSYGAPMPPTSTALEVRTAVERLGTAAWEMRRPTMQTLPCAFVRAARRRPWRFAMADAKVARLSFGGALVKAVFLARRLRRTWAGQEMVGILLPPLVPSALVNIAAALCGKVPVNLNYTLSDEVLASCARQAGIRTVITSRAFLEKVKLTVPATAVYLEDVAAGPRTLEKLAALAMAWLLPARLLLRRLAGRRPAAIDDVATVIFSSGSTGDPKGVMLTHANIAANVEQVAQTFMLGKRDRLLGILPFFHSFGFTGALWLPPLCGMGVAYHPSPLDARGIAALVAEKHVTLMIATPTFLSTYVRRCPPEAFGSLQFVIAGAEKLSDRVAQAFEDRFGVRPLEGYGCTECAPVVTVNTRDYRAPGLRQVGAKRGRIGHPLPGISVEIRDPDTGAPVPAGTPGLLFVRGPNVMRGYLGRPDKTAAVLKDGWYDTGDIAACDADGFLAIADRLSRFSKIGGEMVPHLAVEERLNDLAGAPEQVFAVAGVPDAVRGERLIVLHTLDPEKLAPLCAAFAACDLPALWKPRPDAFVRIDAIPYLGTGKLDLRRLKELALAYSSNPTSPVSSR